MAVRLDAHTAHQGRDVMRLTLVRKLHLLIAAVAAGFVLLGGLAQITMHESEHALEEVSRLPELQALLAERTVDHYRWAQGLAVGSLLLGREFTGKLDPTQCALGEWYRDFTPPPELAETFKAIGAPHARMHATAARVLEPFRAGDVAAAKAVFESETMPALADTQSAIAGMATAVRRMIADHVQEARTLQAASHRRTLTAYGLILLTLGLGATFLLARPLKRSLRALAATFERIGAGDLTARAIVAGRDELAELAKAANVMTDQLRTALLGVSTTTEHVRATAQQLAATSESLSSAVQEQAASLEETSASLGQMTDTVKQNAGWTDALNTKAEDARGGAARGADVVERAVSSMREMTATAKQIRDIVATIDEMAFQTNLLALNAAVEAARAGEQGRSFAVVAGEVRALSQRSAAASREIKTLITATVEKIESGAQLVDHAGAAFTEIVGGVQDVAGLISQISAASREQADGIGQVGRAVVQMDAVTQSNAAQAEELSAAAQSLATGADDLAAQVTRFTLDDGATRAEGAPASPS
jgi:methyl-accepting chemotaxis protein